jgi:hypothetical protein
LSALVSHRCMTGLVHAAAGGGKDRHAAKAATEVRSAPRHTKQTFDLVRHERDRLLVSPHVSTQLPYSLTLPLHEERNIPKQRYEAAGQIGLLWNRQALDLLQSSSELRRVKAPLSDLPEEALVHQPLQLEQLDLVFETHWDSSIRAVV